MFATAFSVTKTILYNEKIYIDDIIRIVDYIQPFCFSKQLAQFFKEATTYEMVSTLVLKKRSSSEGSRTQTKNVRVFQFW